MNAAPIGPRRKGRLTKMAWLDGAREIVAAHGAPPEEIALWDEDRPILPRPAASAALETIELFSHALSLAYPVPDERCKLVDTSWQVRAARLAASLSCSTPKRASHARTERRRGVFSCSMRE